MHGQSMAIRLAVTRGIRQEGPASGVVIDYTRRCHMAVQDIVSEGVWAGTWGTSSAPTTSQNGGRRCGPSSSRRPRACQGLGLVLLRQANNAYATSVVVYTVHLFPLGGTVFIAETRPVLTSSPHRCTPLRPTWCRALAPLARDMLRMTSGDLHGHAGCAQFCSAPALPWRYFAWTMQCRRVDASSSACAISVSGMSSLICAYVASLPIHIQGLAKPQSAIVRLLVEDAGAGRLHEMVARCMTILHREADHPPRLRSSSAACAMCSPMRRLPSRSDLRK